MKNFCDHLSTTVVAVCCLIVSGTLAWAEVDGNWTFTYSDSDSTATITGYSGSASSLTIPSKVSRQVSYQEQDEDGEYHTHYRTYTYSVNALTSRLFKNNTSLSSVTIPISVTSLGSELFSGCTSLHSITIHGNISSIPSSCFFSCSNLSTCTLPTSVTSIGNSAFSGCSSLLSPPLDSIQSIGASAFANCSSFSQVTLGSKITSLGAYAFSGCIGIIEASIDCLLEILPESLFRGCTGLTTVTIGDGVKGLGSGSASYGHPFGYCPNLATFTIGRGITTIPSGYFGLNNGTTTVTMTARGLKTVVLPDTLTTIGAHAFDGCSNLFEIAIPPYVTNIGYRAFFNCTNAFVGALELWPTISGLGEGAFQGCSRITDVTIGCAVPSLPDYLFSRCTALENVTIGDGVKGLGSGSASYGHPFGYCPNLATFTIGRGITTIPSGYFGLNNGTTTVTMTARGLKTVVLPDTLTTIGAHAFDGCSNLFEIAIPPYVTNIEQQALRNCSSLTEIELPATLTYIGYGAFNNCASLSNVCFRGGVPTVGNNPFSGLAPSAYGHYTALHAAEWLSQIGSDGKWQGLIMAEIPGPVLRVESANPAEGSLTLAWDEPATVEGVTYSAYRSANDTYSATDLVTNGLTGTSWTDTAFHSVEPIQKPLNYWVVADGGGYGERVSNRVETRKRYALCVGINEYLEISSLNGCVNDSKYMEKNLIERGGWSSENITRLNDATATKRGIRTAISNVAAKAIPGDTFVYQHSSHGDQYYRDPDADEPLYGEDGKRVFLCVYDELFEDNDTAYNDHELAEDLSGFQAGVAVAVIVDACHSGGLFKDAARPTSKATVAPFDIATRVSALMDVRRKRLKVSGADVSKGISSTGIGWATAVEYYETALDNGFYHTEEWLDNVRYGYEYWDGINKQFNFPYSWELGGVFLAGATWRWWDGTADTDDDAGDKDGYCDVYEFWKQGGDCINRLYDRHAQCLNIEVLRSIELGECKAGTGPIPKRTVIFNANDGNVTPTEKLVPRGHPIGEMPIPIRFLHDFAGWFTAASGGEQIAETTVITSSQTVYAHWTLAAEYAAWVAAQGVEESELPVEEDTDGDGMANWEEYVAGTNPRNEMERLEAWLAWENGTLQLTPSRTIEGRVYTWEGTETLGEEEAWGPTNSASRFFRVRVGMLEE